MWLLSFILTFIENSLALTVMVLVTTSPYLFILSNSYSSSSKESSKSSLSSSSDSIGVMSFSPWAVSWSYDCWSSIGLESLDLSFWSGLSPIGRESFLISVGFGESTPTSYYLYFWGDPFKKESNVSESYSPEYWRSDECWELDLLLDPSFYSTESSYNYNGLV